NAFTKFVAMPMRGHGNVTGGDVIMRWSTGYPFGVNLARGYPRFNPGEFSTIDLLIRGDCDAALVLGADPGATMPQPAIDHLARIPTIVLDPKMTPTSGLARVHITTAATGISAPGTVYRMDEIPLPLRPALKSPYPTDEEVLRRIYQAVAAKPPLVPPQVPQLTREKKKAGITKTRTDETTKKSTRIKSCRSSAGTGSALKSLRFFRGFVRSCFRDSFSAFSVPSVVSLPRGTHLCTATPCCESPAAKSTTPP